MPIGICCLPPDEVEMMDSCASGGHRLDLETMRRAVALHPTDFNYNDLASKQIGSYGLASWFPSPAPTPALQTIPPRPTSMCSRSAYRQALILQYNINTLDSRYYKIAEDCVNEWKGISKYFYDNLYQLTNSTTGYNEWYSYEYLSEENQDGFALVFRRSSSAPSSQR